MSKLGDKYNELKIKDSSKVYVFKLGAFYTFLNEDAKSISKLLNLKITSLGNELIKCGIPIKSKGNKLEILDLNNIKYEIVELEKKCTKEEEVINDILNLNLANLTDREAFINICNYKMKLGGK